MERRARHCREAKEGVKFVPPSSPCALTRMGTRGRREREVSNLGHVSWRLEFPEGGRGEAQRIQGSKSDPSHHSPPCVIANSIISMVYPNTTSPFAWLFHSLLLNCLKAGKIQQSCLDWTSPLGHSLSLEDKVEADMMCLWGTGVQP